MKKRFGFFVVALLAASCAFAQTIEPSGDKGDKNILNHLDGSVTLGTTGVGVDLAMPIGKMVQVRTGFNFFPHYKQTMHFGVQVGDDTDPTVQDEKFNKLSQTLNEMFAFEVDRNVDMKGKPTMKNFKLLVDVFPFRNKHWHVTTGFYWGPSTVAKAENAAYDATSLVSVAIYNNLYNRVKESWESQISDDPNVIPIPCISIGGNKIYADESLYNKFMDYGRMGVHVGDYPDGTPYRMEPDANNMVSCKIKVNNFRPYLGFGYGGKLSNRSDRNWISFDCGAMFWGGTPRVITHDGVDLAKDVKNISGKVGDYVSLFKAVKVYPVLELRLTHRIF